MTTLYAFLRLTDDLADEPGDAAAKRIALADWRSRTRAAFTGHFTHLIHPALHDLVTRVRVPFSYLDAVIEGVESDLEPMQFATFENDLYPYCWKVASAVGLACLSIWGLRNPSDQAQAVQLAEKAGISFQLTNILRDLGEDRTQGRVYLPREDLSRFDCPPERWHPAEPSFQALMRFQVARARQYYDESAPLADLLRHDGRAVFHVMAAIYRRLLDEIEHRNYDVFSGRVRVRKRTKVRIFLGAWPIRFGWW